MEDPPKKRLKAGGAAGGGRGGSGNLFDSLMRDVTKNRTAVQAARLGIFQSHPSTVPTFLQFDLWPSSLSHPS